MTATARFQRLSLVKRSYCPRPRGLLECNLDRDLNDSIKIYPADSKASEKFEKIKKQIHSVLGKK
jgi:GrpB-like predicted nucleotidyltransferase (UPF0157 family)